MKKRCMMSSKMSERLGETLIYSSFPRKRKFIFLILSGSRSFASVGEAIVHGFRRRRLGLFALAPLTFTVFCFIGGCGVSSGNSQPGKTVSIDKAGTDPAPDSTSLSRDTQNPELSLLALIPKAQFVSQGSGSVRWSGLIKGDKSEVQRYSVLLKRIPENSVGVPMDIALAEPVPPSAPATAREALAHAGGYWLDLTPHAIRLQAGSESGIARGLVRLAALARIGEQAAMPTGQWADWPDLPIRALHIVVNAKVGSKDLRRMADLASAAEFNTLITVVTPSVGLSSFGSLGKSNGITQDQFASFVRYAHQSGLVVVPGLTLLTHQEKLLGKHFPSLMYNRWTYNPEKPKVYKIVFPIINQLLVITGAPAFMIGHDELAGWKPSGLPKVLSLAPGAKPLPASLFVKDVKTLYGHLTKRGVKTWMWGDMLLQPDSFPSVQQFYLHGRLPGYGSALWKELPKGIVICDWEYTGNNFEPLAALAKYGFPVMGATWKDAKTIKDFSEFATRHGAKGMIATIWFYLQRHQWETVERIVRLSGDAFWNANTQ